jgi:Protein of unknown function (DUF3611)
MHPLQSSINEGEGENNDTDTENGLDTESTTANTSTTTTTTMIRQVSKTLQRTSWISWWSQVILTVISSIILLFAKSITPLYNNSSRTNNFVLSGIGIFWSTLSILWTWGNGTRLSQRLLRTATTTATPLILPTATTTATTNATLTSTKTISSMIQRAVTIGVVLNCVGLFCNLIAAQQIIGLFAIKVFTNSASRGAGVVAATALYNTIDNTLQPLDILILQANTNVSLSHYISLIALLSLIPNIVHKLHSSTTTTKDRDASSNNNNKARKPSR